MPGHKHHKKHCKKSWEEKIAEAVAAAVAAALGTTKTCSLANIPAAQLVARVPILDVDAPILIPPLLSIFGGLDFMPLPQPNFPDVISVTGTTFQLHCAGYYEVTWHIPTTITVALAGIGIAINGVLDVNSVAAPMLVSLGERSTNDYIFRVSDAATVQLVNADPLLSIAIGVALVASTAVFNIKRLSGIPVTRGSALCAPCTQVC